MQTTSPTPAAPATAHEVTPEPGDMLCIRQGAHAWGYSGDRFSRFEGQMIVAQQTYASGAVRFTRGDDRAFRVLRGTQLFRVKMPDPCVAFVSKVAQLIPYGKGDEETPFDAESAFDTMNSLIANARAILATIEP